MPTLREQAIFSQYGQPQQDDYSFYDPVYNATGAPGPVQTPPMRPIDNSIQQQLELVNQVYKPEYTSRDRFNTMIDQFPERKQGSALTAGLMGLGAYSRNQDPTKVMDTVLYGGGDRQIEDWKVRTDAGAKAAQFENTANANERTLAGNLVNAQTQANRLGEQTRLSEERNRISNFRAETDRLKAQGWTIKILGDRVVGFDKNNQRHDLGPSGGMTEMDKIMLQNEGRIAAAEAGAGFRADQGGQVYVGEDGQPVIINPRRPGSPAVPVPNAPPGVVKPGTEKTRPQNAKEDFAANQAKLENLRVNHPAGKWIKKNEQGMWELDANGPKNVRGYFGSSIGSKTATDEEIAAYNELKGQIYPKQQGIGPSNLPGSSPEKQSSIGPSRTPTQAQPPPGIPAGARIQTKGNQWRYSTDGGKTWKIVSY